MQNGFSLVVTLSLMILLTIVAVGLLSLSAVSLRSGSQALAQAEAQANARLALMLAIGKLQMEMGPDMRISAEAAIHDANPATEIIDGVAQPHWTAVYDSWGNWLNGSYKPEGKSQMTIGDTYGSKRAPMFRSWLVSLPENLQDDVNAANATFSKEETVLMVGEGTLGRTHVGANPEDVTRAYKIQTEGNGAFAWWVSPENHKAKIGLAAQKRELSKDQWAVAQGVSSEVGIGGLTGLENLDTSNANATPIAKRIISLNTLQLADVDKEIARSLFFDLTEVSSGVLANTRSGGLKKDLSLLFENNDASIPQQYKQAAPFGREPSIRPHSKDVLAQNAVLPLRPFASWPAMRQYYRLYRTDKDTPLPQNGTGIQYGATRQLKYAADRGPYSFPLVPYKLGDAAQATNWHGDNAYQRFPILVKLLLIHSYRTERVDHDNNPSTPDQVRLIHTDVPVPMFWNPYSVPLIINNDVLRMNISSRTIWPHRMVLYDNANKSGNSTVLRTSELSSPTRFRAEGAGPIVFEPGALKVFSLRNNGSYTFGATNTAEVYMYEGFDPSGALHGFSATGGINMGTRKFLDVQFDFGAGIGGRPVSGNNGDGNVPGSLSVLHNIYEQNNERFRPGIPTFYQVDWFQKSQQHESLLQSSGGLLPIVESQDLLPVAYSLLTLKSTSQLEQTFAWAKDWRTRNWLHSPPHYYGSALFMTEVSEKRAHTQRLDNPYEVNFGPTSPSELLKLTGEINGRHWLGFGSNPYEKVTAAPMLELPTAPISSLAGFSGMRMSPGFIWYSELNPGWVDWRGYKGFWHNLPIDPSTGQQYITTQFNGAHKLYAYQSGMTGPGIGNSFLHPMIPADGIYQYHDNSVTHVQRRKDLAGNTLAQQDLAASTTDAYDTKAFNDYWDHTLLLNDALWDEYFISSIADQTRPWASEADNLDANLDSLTSGEGLPISRYQYHSGGLNDSEVKARIKAGDGYLRAAEHLIVDGAFNVNSTSVNAWYALFKGIRERKLLYRNSSGQLQEVNVPAGHIAISRFDTPTSGQETTNLSRGVAREDGCMEWSGVRFLNDEQVRLLAEKCVEQVKRRGPFLNFSEFINRRLEKSDLGVMGALQSAIDFDDASPDPRSINYQHKSASNLRIEPGSLGDHEYPSPEAVEGSRLAGIPGYVIQSDILKPIANTLQVRDDTFRIRAYGESLDTNGKVTARAWCEAIVQRKPEYYDEANDPNEPKFKYISAASAGYDPNWEGKFESNTNLTQDNRRFGRKFEINSFRWLAADEI